MGIAILTDSTCDLDSKLLAKYHIETIPLSVHFAEEVYQDGIDIDSDLFFKKLQENKAIPSTSRPSVGLFLEKYKKMLQKHDQIISIHVSSALSGTYESAKLAAQELDADIEIIDSSTISLGLGMLVVLAAELIENNNSLPKIVEQIERAKKNLYLYFTVKDLKYMEKGGRIGKASAFLGSILKINPIIAIDTVSGEVKAITKVRGKKRAKNKLIEILNEKIKNKKDFWLAFAHGDRKEDLNEMKKDLLNTLKTNSISNFKSFNSRISATLGSHVGPTVYAVILLVRDNLDLK